MAKKKLDPASADQKRAWAFYGDPNSGQAPGIAIGEIRYVVGWLADQMVRMGWRLRLGNLEKWSIALPDGDTVTSDPDVADVEDDRHPLNASRTVLLSIDWNERTVREVTTNLFVAGELHYVLENETWRVISVIRKDRDELYDKASIKVRGLWPHPADPTRPDAPLFGVLNTLDDLLWLNRLSRSQSANRVATRGVMGISDGFTTSTGAAGEEFWNEFEAMLSRPMDDPEDVSPAAIRGATDLVKPEGSGMAGLSWVIPEFPYDDKIDARIDKLINRVAYGLPIPPEILLGLQAQSKATAFQVEGATYRAHIEPVALLVCQIATDALAKLLPDEEGLEIVPDPTNILARRHSVSDVLEAFDRGAVGYAYLREVLGIPDGSKMTDEDIALFLKINGKTENIDGVSDPARVAENEPISAAATLPAAELEAAPKGDPDDEYLSEQLHLIDYGLLHELIGAGAQAVTKARERLGATVRSSKAFKAQIPANLTNDEIATRLGQDGFAALGIDEEKVVSGAIQGTMTWWTKRMVRAQEDSAAVLSDFGIEADFSVSRSAESSELLETLLSTAVFSEAPIQDAAYREVVDLAGSA